jgi:hypothetical protein
MYFISIQTVALFVASVSAHGYVTQILFGDKLVDTWNPYKDPQKNVLKITRKFLDNGPVTDNAFLVCSYLLNFFTAVWLRSCLDRRNHLQLWCKGHCK